MLTYRIGFGSFNLLTLSINDLTLHPLLRFFSVIYFGFYVDFLHLMTLGS